MRKLLLNVALTHAVVDKLDSLGVAEGMGPEAERLSVGSGNPTASHESAKCIGHRIRAYREANAAWVGRRKEVVLRVGLLVEGLLDQFCLEPYRGCDLRSNGHMVTKHARFMDVADQPPLLGERGLIEVVAAMGYYLMIGCVLIATDMEPKNLTEWRVLRQELTQRQAARALQRRFRHDPTAYLADAERLLH